MKVLVTGGAGFSGSHLCDYIIDNTDWDLVVLDALTYAGDMKNLSRITDDADRAKRFKFIHHDFSFPLDDEIVEKCRKVNYIVHLGAETHVLNSLYDRDPFIQSNIVGTYNMLEAAIMLQPKKFLYISTDEVLGASPPHIALREDKQLRPSNPYSASKAAGEMLVKAYQSSFNLPCLITRTSNIFGVRQHEEKFIPMTIKKIRNNEITQIHTGPNGEVGSRQWIHARDQADAILFLLNSPQVNETYHIAGERKTNLEIFQTLTKAMGRQNGYSWREVNAFDMYHGHDLHYNLDDSKLRALGWKPQLTFEEGLALTVHDGRSLTS